MGRDSNAFRVSPYGVPYLSCFSLGSSVRLVFLPTLFCALAASCVLNNGTEHSQGSSRSLSYTKGPVNFFVSWVRWVKDLRRTTWFSGRNRGGSDTSKSFGPSPKGVASFPALPMSHGIACSRVNFTIAIHDLKFTLWRWHRIFMRNTRSSELIYTSR